MSFFRILFLLFLSIPILEIYLLLEVGDRIGLFPTIGLVVFTAVVGVWLLRVQGFATLARAQASLSRGEVPASTMIEGVMLFIAGALLLTPGFFTDAVGFIFLIPMTRQWIASSILKNGVMRGAQFGATAGAFTQTNTQENIKTGETYQSTSTEVIEGEFISHDEKKK